LITKSAALEKFITERVLGDRPFAYDAQMGACRYNHAFAGGCEIGQYLSERDAQLCDGGSMVGSSYRALRSMNTFHRIFDETFEDPASEFWSTLQNAHDALAQMQNHANKQGSAAWATLYSNAWARWRSFAGYLQQLVRLT
jgi:hypothetical protein